jgi:2-polyprenyl-3-methyl-5-hydroxy-6-metoxy-1,4-benzoquinol methylase
VGRGTSGTGSTLDITREYRSYIEDFIKKHHVKSVVDAGCGDWEFSSATDWNHARYTGVDISSEVIDYVEEKYEKNGVSFMVGDVTDGDNHDIEVGKHHLIDLSAPPFNVKGLIDLPIKFGGESAKLTQILPFSQ